MFFFIAGMYCVVAHVLFVFITDISTTVEMKNKELYVFLASLFWPFTLLVFFFVVCMYLWDKFTRKD